MSSWDEWDEEEYPGRPYPDRHAGPNHYPIHPGTHADRPLLRRGHHSEIGHQQYNQGYFYPEAPQPHFNPHQGRASAGNLLPPHEIDHDDSDETEDPWRPPSAHSDTYIPRYISIAGRTSPPSVRHSYATRVPPEIRSSSKKRREASKPHRASPPPLLEPPPPTANRRKIKARRKSIAEQVDYSSAVPPPAPVAPTDAFDAPRARPGLTHSASTRSARSSSSRLVLPIRSNEVLPHQVVEDVPSKSKARKNRTQTPEIQHFQIPGGFPLPQDNIQPDESRSNASQLRAIKDKKGPKTARSTISRTSSSSGTLGPKTYQYEALEDHEIRLVKILPARMSTIKCEIIHAPLNHTPEYVAVSYAWGDADDTRKILVEGAAVPIAASLHGALGAIRRKDKSVYVWVDALCIDQQNKEERAEQVRYMTAIYKNAKSVAIWLGPELDQSNLAMDLMEDISESMGSHAQVIALIADPERREDFAAAVSLFERDYWRRLWVVQEVYNAKDIIVYCGAWALPWKIFKAASSAFWTYREHLDYYFPKGLSLAQEQGMSQNQFAVSQVLAYQGPNSIPDSDFISNLGDDPLLGVMCACRRKLTSDPRDKIFGILGVLPENLRSEFPVDYNLSIKEVYINVVDLLLSTTESLEVICESIHFPVHTSSANLPTWVPDWSHITELTALGHLGQFSAAGKHRAEYRFLDERRNRLEISAIHLDTIKAHGIAMGTLCTTSDYLMAFLHWRAMFLSTINPNSKHNMIHAHEAFCRTICIDQVPDAWNDSARWVTACYHVFSSLIRDRLPRLPLDAELEHYVKADIDINPEARRSFLQQHFKRMMGRCFCLTENGCMGLGSGFMGVGDIVVVPLGCKTPIILRPEGRHGEYRYVGDVYIHGYMQGKAIDEWKSGEREEGKYVLH